MDIRALEDDLFERWGTRYPECFVRDGAPDPNTFLDSAVKTVMVLKEINAPNDLGVFDLRGQLESTPHDWWLKVGRWCAALSRCDEDLSWVELERVGADVRECLRPFVFMQLKKSPGGGSAMAQTLAEVARRDAKEIREQIGIYRPHIIVCANVGSILADLLGGGLWSLTRRGVRYQRLILDNRPTYLIDYMHPSVRATPSVVCYGLLDAYREVLSQIRVQVPGDS